MDPGGAHAASAHDAAPQPAGGRAAGFEISHALVEFRKAAEMTTMAAMNTMATAAFQVSLMAGTSFEPARCTTLNVTPGAPPERAEGQRGWRPKTLLGLGRGKCRDRFGSALGSLPGEGPACEKRAWA